MPKTRAEIKAKHPATEVPDEAISDRLQAAANIDKRISCRSAHEIAHGLNCPPLKVGETADLIEIRIHRCQLGLFGSSETTSTTEITPEIRAAVESAASDGRVACADTWQLADRIGLSRLEMGALCDALGIKVSPCQLGAF